jgi:hypothetical protein
MRKWGLHYLAGLLVLAVVLAGCGSSNENSAANSASTSNMKSDQGVANAPAEEAAPAAAEVEAGSGSADTSASSSSVDANAAAGTKGMAVKGSDSDKAAEAAAGLTGTDVVAGLNKKLMYKANLTMEVEDYAAAQSEVRNMITLSGGYIIGFTESMSEYEKGGTFIMKVPASGFSPFLNNLEKIKNEGIQRNIEGQDVSEEYVDLESRLKAKQLMESQYIEFMKKATKSADLVAFANQLGAIQEQIEQIKGRMRYIDQNVSFSTVELRLYQTDKSIADIKQKEQGPLLTRASDALTSSLHALSVMFQWLIVFLAAALPILIVAGIILVIVLWLRKKLKRRDDGYLQRIRAANRAQNRELSGRDGGEEIHGDAPVTEETGKETENKG